MAIRKFSFRKLILSKLPLQGRLSLSRKGYKNNSPVFSMKWIQKDPKRIQLYPKKFNPGCMPEEKRKINCWIPASMRRFRVQHRGLYLISKYINMREVPSQVKGAGFRVQSCRSSCVRITPLASNFFSLLVI